MSIIWSVFFLIMNHDYINQGNPLVLGSVSPRRRDILEQLGIPFESIGSMIEETLCQGIDLKDLVCQMALRKAQSLCSELKNRWILSADTIVAVNEKIFGKPKDYRECYDMLTCLSGQEHMVVTGFSILDPEGETSHIEAVITKVTIKGLSKSEIDGYIKTGEPYGKAGAYAIQGIGSFMIKKIQGSYTNVVGLPVYELINALLRCGGLEVFPLIDGQG